MRPRALRDYWYQMLQKKHILVLLSNGFKTCQGFLFLFFPDKTHHMAMNHSLYLCARQGHLCILDLLTDFHCMISREKLKFQKKKLLYIHTIINI